MLLELTVGGLSSILSVNCLQNVCQSTALSNLNVSCVSLLETESNIRGI